MIFAGLRMRSERRHGYPKEDMEPGSSGIIPKPLRISGDHTTADYCRGKILYNL